MSKNKLMLIAMVTMLIDHIGALYYPNYTMFRYIGRLALPIYIYLYSRVDKHNIKRLIVVAIISQLGYSLIAGFRFNIIVLFIYYSLTKNIKSYIKYLPLIFVPVDYGLYGYILLQSVEKNNFKGVLLITLIYSFVSPYQLISLPVFYYLMKNSLINDSNIYIKSVYKIFYPLHLSIFFLVRLLTLCAQ